MIFASNDEDQTRFAALKTPACKWVGAACHLPKIRVHLRRKVFAVAFAENLVPLGAWSLQLGAVFKLLLPLCMSLNCSDLSALELLEAMRGGGGTT